MARAATTAVAVIALAIMCTVRAASEALPAKAAYGEIEDPNFTVNNCTGPLQGTVGPAQYNTSYSTAFDCSVFSNSARYWNPNVAIVESIILSNTVTVMGLGSFTGPYKGECIFSMQLFDRNGQLQAWTNSYNAYYMGYWAPSVTSQVTLGPGSYYLKFWTANSGCYAATASGCRTWGNPYNCDLYQVNQPQSTSYLNLTAYYTDTTSAGLYLRYKMNNNVPDGGQCYVSQQCSSNCCCKFPTLNGTLCGYPSACNAFQGVCV